MLLVERCWEEKGHWNKKYQVEILEVVSVDSLQTGQGHMN